MKKKNFVTSKDKNDWSVFIKQMDNISPKESDISNESIDINRVRKLDLHGFSLHDANKVVKKFIIDSSNYGYRKLLVVTGKGLRSQTYNNPYLSKKLSVLKYAIPEYIKNEETLNERISSISPASIKDGGNGAIYIFLRNKKKFTR